METTNRNPNVKSRARLSPRSWLLFCALISTLLGACQQTTQRSAKTEATSRSTGFYSSHLQPTDGDTRIPLPLLPHMAQHQTENMRDHLAAIQEILAAISTNNFTAVEQAASRIGYSEQMARMCEHMGAGAAGFTEIALNFHRTADTIAIAAKARDSVATLKAVSATLQTCVACHAIYRQQIVDKATWSRIESGARQSGGPQSAKW